MRPWRGHLLVRPRPGWQAVPVTERAAAAADAIERALRTDVPASRAAASRAYLKIDLQFIGTSVPQARSLVTQWRRERPGLDRPELLAVVTALWDRPVFECRMAALLLLVDRVSLLQAADIDLIEQLLRQSGTG